MSNENVFENWLGEENNDFPATNNFSFWQEENTSPFTFPQGDNLWEWNLDSNNLPFWGNDFWWDFAWFTGFEENTKKEKVSPSNIKTPTNKAKMILAVISVIIIFLSLSFWLYIDKKFKAIWNQKQDVSTDSSNTSNPNAITFWGQELTGEYNESQLWILKKIEQWGKLSVVEETLLAKMIFQSPEIKNVIRIKFKNYFPQ